MEKKKAPVLYMQNKIDAFRKSEALISAKLDKIGIQNKAKKNFMILYPQVKKQLWHGANFLVENRQSAV